MRKRHLRPSIKTALQVIIGIICVIAMLTAWVCNVGTVNDRLNDHEYLQAERG